MNNINSRKKYIRGTVIGPTEFTVYISGSLCLKTGRLMVSYADDTAIISGNPAQKLVGSLCKTSQS